MGTLVPAATHNTTASPAGQFNTLVGVGSNGCKRSGNALCPAYLLTWLDGHDGLKVVKNTTITMTSTPTSFLAPNSWISSPTQTIIRTANNSLLLAVYGKVSDGKMICSGGKKLCYTTAFYGSSDDGTGRNIRMSTLHAYQCCPVLPHAISCSVHDGCALIF